MTLEASSSQSRRHRSGDVCDRPEKNQRIILGRDESASLPEFCGFHIDRMDDQSASTDQAGGGDAALQRVADKARSNSPPDPVLIGRKLSEKQAGNRIGRLPRADRSWQRRGQDGGRRETVIADHSIGLVNDEDRCKAFFLIGECSRL